MLVLTEGRKAAAFVGEETSIGSCFTRKCLEENNDDDDSNDDDDDVDVMRTSSRGSVLM